MCVPGRVDASFGVGLGLVDWFEGKFPFSCAKKKMYAPKASFCCCFDSDFKMEILVALIFVAFHQSLTLASCLPNAAIVVVVLAFTVDCPAFSHLVFLWSSLFCLFFSFL